MLFCFSNLYYLTILQLIYYRLSASSVLVSKGGVVKLSGFGFPQDITERNLYEKVWTCDNNVIKLVGCFED